MRGLIAIVVAGGALVSAGCTGEARSITPTAPTTPASVSAIEISGVAPTTSSFQLTATARMSNGATQDVTGAAVWQSSNPQIASVTSGGLVSVVANGDVDLRATYQGVTGSVHVTTNVLLYATFAGVVIDAAGGSGVSGARVQLIGGDHVVTDDHGAFSFPHIRTGRLLVEVSKTGYQTVEQEVAFDHDLQLTLVLSKTAP